MIKSKTNDSVLALGLGIGLGATIIWAAVELLPIVLIGGGVYIAFKAIDPSSKKEGE